MSALTTLYRGETKIDFVGQAQRWFAVSGIVLALCAGSLAIRNLNLSIDFTGGTAVESPNPNGADIGEVRDAVEAVVSTARIQMIDDGASVRVQTEAVELDVERAMVLALIDTTGADIVETNVDSVGPTFGRQIAQRALQALVVFLAVVVVFISIRFEWKMAVAAIAALIHDLLITFGAYSTLGFEVTPATVVAILTILGYSLYDTVVVFDKIKENVARRAGPCHLLLHRQRLDEPGAHAFDQHLADEPSAGRFLALHRLVAPGGRNVARVRLGTLRRHRRRHVFLHLHRLASPGVVEGARGRVVAAAISRGQESRSWCVCGFGFPPRRVRRPPGSA